MIGLQIAEKGKIVKINKMEICENADTSKVKILSVLLTPEDFQTFNGDDAAVYPVIPGRIALGQISDTREDAFLHKGMKVYINPVTACGECVNCLSGLNDDCVNLRVAGKNTDGYLRDFAVVNNRQMYFLPESIKNDDVLLVDYIALSLAIIDKLGITKGEHVSVIGGGIIGLLISLLIIYYQGVPILIDGSEQNLEKAKNAGIYYNLFSGNKVESEVSELTGAHMTPKVIYVSDSNVNTDLALKLASNKAKIGVVGFSSPNLKVNFSLAMSKQLEFCCVTNGFRFVEQAINIIINKVINTSLFTFDKVKYESCESAFEKRAKQLKETNEYVSPLLVDMM